MPKRGAICKQVFQGKLASSQGLGFIASIPLLITEVPQHGAAHGPPSRSLVAREAAGHPGMGLGRLPFTPLGMERDDLSAAEPFASRAGMLSLAVQGTGAKTLSYSREMLRRHVLLNQRRENARG